jgi:hypothetical protein
VLSVLVVAVACVVYLRPSTQPAADLPAASTGYQLDAVDFVDPSTGWVLADLDTSGLAVAVETWSKLTMLLVSEAAGRRVHALLRPIERRGGGDRAEAAILLPCGGAHWTRRAVDAGDVYVMSAAFVDPLHGWLLGFGAVSTGPGSIAPAGDGGATGGLRADGDPVGPGVALSFTD